ncbi:MAG: DUF2461 domain-containing protein [Oscillospiraceae bacterium]|nr:DUF2461 domain-containing protein [Oscillospiraceae bacterium]
MPFSAGTLDFLFENMMNDSKVWFNEHKEDYKQKVVEPFAELVTDLTDTMLKIDGQLICDPKKISRIYRDARYAKGKFIFRDHLWYTFSRTRDAYDTAGFYFSISPNGFDYGCGFYWASTETMERLRGLILSDDKLFKQALKAYKNQNVFTLYGDMYKRNHYPDESAEKQDWLNRKVLGLSCESKDFDLLFSDRLAERVAEDFKAIAPIYKFFMG